MTSGSATASRVSAAGAASAAGLRAAARAFSPDPFPDHPFPDDPFPDDPSGSEATDAGLPAARTPWLYAPGDYELALLDRLVREGFAANRFVHYADNYARPPVERVFRRGGEERRALSIPGVLFGDGDGWQVLTETGWVTPDARLGGERPPHEGDEPLVELPLVELPLRALGAEHPFVFDVGATVLGRPVFRWCGPGAPAITSGESLAEALAGASELETRHDVVALGAPADGLWTSVHRLGFRYLRVLGGEASGARVRASVRPQPRPGVFLCSDDELNRLWGTAAYTSRVCRQGLVLDGIKRDRMPWAGDQALNTISNAYAAGDGAIVRDGLVALGRPTSGYVNGIADYSLWWLIGQALYQRYVGDPAHALREAPHVDAFVAALAAECTVDGVFRPTAEGFGGLGAIPVLIDWGVRIEPGRDLTALQLLWLWALRSATSVLRTAGHASAARWSAFADRLEATLRREAWDAPREVWREYLGAGAGAEDVADVSPYPNVIAVLSGLGDGGRVVGGEADGTGTGTGTGTERVGAGVLAAVRAGVDGRVDGGVRTPWMTAFALRALADAGQRTEAVARLRERWAPMLASGATTFWEEFAEPGASEHEMYGRPFGKSLSHAWGAGPAGLLPEFVLGIRPTADGWAEFEVRPELGELSWASAVVPTPHGDVVVTATPDEVTVELPAGTRLAHPAAVGPATVGPAMVGPATARWSRR